MARFKTTLVDTIHVLAVVTVTCLLIALVFARHEPAWADFILNSAAVLAGSTVLARIISRSGRR
jgi:hypothetical protein